MIYRVPLGLSLARLDRDTYVTGIRDTYMIYRVPLGLSLARLDRDTYVTGIRDITWRPDPRQHRCLHRHVTGIRDTYVTDQSLAGCPGTRSHSL